MMEVKMMNIAKMMTGTGMPPMKPWPRNLNASGMPVIGSIGEMVTRVQAEERARRLKWLAGGTAALLASYIVLLGVEMVQRGMAA